MEETVEMAIIMIEVTRIVRVRKKLIFPFRFQSFILLFSFIHTASLPKNYPFTAPAAMPLISLSCAKMNNRIIGRTVRVRTDIIIGVFMEYCP